MTLDTSGYEDAIVARIKTVCPRVYVTEIPDTVATPAYPYVIVRWIEPVRLGTGHHMVGSRNDAQRAGAMISCVSLDDTSARAIKNRIRDSLGGYRPPDCDEIEFEGGLAYSTSNSAASPTTFSRDIYCSWVTNLSPNDLLE